MTGKPSAPMSDLLAKGLTLHKSGRLAEAESCYRDLLAANPKFARARALLGTLLHQSGNSAVAIEEIERAIRDQPAEADMHINLAGVYLAVERFADAADACRRAIDLNPNVPAAYFNLGDALRKVGDWKGAIPAYENYLRLRPTDGLGYGALGDSLKELGNLEGAMTAFEQALIYAPEHPGAYVGVSDLLFRKRLPGAALVVLEKAAALAPEDKDINRRCGQMKILCGDLAGGWDLLDENRFSRDKRGLTRRPTPPPYWQGENLSGKRILVWNEQGVGDECLYASILPDVVGRAVKCVLASSVRMAPIFARSFPAVEVRPWDGTELPVRAGDGFDFQIAIGSLGRYLRRDFASFPKHDGYLKADPAKTTRLRRRYEAIAQGRRIVGLAWKSKHRVYGQSKSTTPSDLGAILEVPGTLFINLQYGDCAEEIAAAKQKFGVEIHQDPEIDPLTDMDGFCAQVAAMDLVISTSNSAAHVAGAMNVPTWLLLPYGRGALWYWFLRREDSPWYPSMKIFRAAGASSDQPWETEAVSRAGAHLAQWVRGQD
jgi:tetratricopeptide (TPR) repeat protein